MKRLVLFGAFILVSLLVACNEESAAPEEIPGETIVDTVYVDRIDTLIDTLIADNTDTLIVNRYHDVIERDTLFTDPECTTSEIDGLVTVTCGSKHTLVYKGSCDSISYDPTKNFCYQGNILDFCGGFSYDPSRYFCYNDSLVLLCSGSSYDFAKRFCREGTILDLCGEKSYDPTKSFCYEDSLVDLCRGNSYDPKKNICQDDSLIGLCRGALYDLSSQFCDERDGQVYRMVTIGEQTWMAENLNYAYNEKTSNLDSSSFCYNNEPDSCAKYGRLYLWSAAMDSSAVFSNDGKGCGHGATCNASGTIRGVCPEGWHLPSNDEWNSLFTAVGEGSTVGSKLKSTSGWDHDGNGEDSFGFSVLPAGDRNYSGGFYTAGSNAYFWSSAEGNISDVPCWYFYFIDANIRMDRFGKNLSFSVRCVRNSN